MPSKRTTPPKRVQRIAKAAIESAPGETVPVGNLLEADVFLYHGTSWLAKAIRFFDGTDVNHASLYIGGAPPSVIEALAKGLTKNDVPKTLSDSEWVLARRLKTRPTSMQVVLEKGQSYLGKKERYAYEQLLLLAMLSVVRKPKITPIFKKLLSAVLENAASLLLKITAAGKQPMICSEFVYRCYDEATIGSPDSFALEILRGAAPEAAPGHPDSILACALSLPLALPKGAASAEAAAPGAARLNALIKTYLEEVRHPIASVESVPDVFADPAVKKAFGRYATALHRARGHKQVTIKPAAAIESLSAVVAHFVTPGDLLKSPTLMTLGKIVQ